MRARNIKPGLFKNEVLGAASPLFTVVFEGLWCMADKEGRLEDRPLRIHAEVNPFRPPRGTMSALTWLADNSFIIRYEVNGEKFIQISGFHKHQNPHQREAASIIPSQGTAKAQPRLVKGTAKGKASPADSPSLIPDSPSLIPEVPGSTNQVERVFEHWKTVFNHPKAQLDAKRRSKIKASLKAYTEADLCRAISGYLNSPHHMGENDRATVYDDIGLLLRDSSHIDAGLRFYAEPPRTDLSKITRRNVAAVADWQPPETRNATR